MLPPSLLLFVFASGIENGAGTKSCARVVSNYYNDYHHMLETPKTLSTRRPKGPEYGQ
jgi:hypothetical protein